MALLRLGRSASLTRSVTQSDKRGVNRLLDLEENVSIDSTEDHFTLTEFVAGDEPE